MNVLFFTATRPKDDVKAKIWLGNCGGNVASLAPWWKGGSDDGQQLGFKAARQQACFGVQGSGTTLAIFLAKQ